MGVWPGTCPHREGMCQTLVYIFLIRAYCACGNILNYPNNTLNDTSCNTGCNGNQLVDLNCGGLNGISIYQVAITTTTTTTTTLSTTIKTSTSLNSSPSTIDEYLTHYWPIYNSDMTDYVGSAHMMQGNLTSFTADRFGCSNSALALNGGWTRVPSGIYFNTPEFTISVWVWPQLIGSFARVINFGNGQSDSIIVSLDGGTNRNG